MRNKDYFEYISKKPFEERLKAFGDSCENMIRYSYEGVRSGISKEDRQWYHNEYKAQEERVNFLFKNLLEDYEKRSDK